VKKISLLVILASLNVVAHAELVDKRTAPAQPIPQKVEVTPSGVSPPKPTAAPLPELSSDKVARQWYLKASYHSLKEALDDWGSTVGFEVIYDTREFPLDLKADKWISSGDFWQALKTVGESYRNSDAPWQIQPTDFNQIVVVPMSHATDIVGGHK
jgi:hypothetical protein